MAREVPRTVETFLPPYQQGIESDEIEIIVMENGSTEPIATEVVENWPDNVRYIKVENPKASPANALNEGVKLSRGAWVCPVIDGARMITPSVIKSCKDMMKVYDNPVIATIGYHLGSIIQQENVNNGYNQQVEDELLASINWPNNPYEIFNISCLGGSARALWLGKLPESNVLIMRKEFYLSISGYDEAFNIPGGGLVNLDFFKRCVDHPNSQYILLLGEGSFHQFHGGVTTSRSVSKPSLTKNNMSTWEEYAQQYAQIRGENYKHADKEPILYGQVNANVKRETLIAAKHIININAKQFK